MQRAPEYGAVPSAADREKKQDKLDTETEKLEASMEPDALRRWQELQEDRPAMAETVKDELLKMFRRGQLAMAGGLDGPLTLAALTALIDKQSQAATNAKATIARNRRRFDDSDDDDDDDGDL